MAKAKVEKTKCTCCGQEKDDFYLSFSEVFRATNKFCICRDCIIGLYEEYLEETKDEQKAIYNMCRLLNIHYDVKLLEGAKQQSSSRNTHLIQAYIQKANSLKQYKGLTFKDTAKQEEKLGVIKEVKRDNTQIIKSNELNEEELKLKEDCIRMLGYDPFEGYDIQDQKVLYGELVPFLDEDTLEDPYKISVILQIVNNNNQIKKANLAINNLGADIKSLVENSKDISALTDMTTKWNQQNDKLSKENNIALKHRGDSGSKNSTLGSTMKKLRELGFEDAEHNYYDMKKAYGMKFSADISHKSIIDIVHFDDNDKNIIFKNQREELQKFQEKELDYREEIRKLVTENAKLKDIINELESK